jgi:2',3'-cyclic-nucleotide 2'-phosphodiesterase (5'-nucleotidase family)
MVIKMLRLLTTSLFLTVLLFGQPPGLQRAESRPINESVAEDAAILKALDPAKKEILASFGKVIATSPDGLLRGRVGEENLLGYWIADTMRARAAALLGVPVKFAFTNRGGIRGNVKVGDVKVGDIFEVMPFENEMLVLELTGAEVSAVMKESFLRRAGDPSSGVVAVLSGTLEKPVFTVTWEDGKPIAPDEVVKVATSDYLYEGGDGIPTLKKGRRPYTTGLTIRQILLDACQELGKAGKPLLPPKGGRYLIPPDFFQAIRDKKLVLP